MNNNQEKITNNIQIAFARLIGPLAIMSVLDSYKTKRNEIKKLLDTIVNWGAKFELEQNLDFIKADELLNVYEEINNLNTEFLYNPKLGNESFLSDEIVIWMWQIMELRKKLIERNEKNGRWLTIRSQVIFFKNLKKIFIPLQKDFKKAVLNFMTDN